eukprot:TRINITY_DN976_c0_g1_i2.p2 TRINITY_DN976_c0_g1~~TRINITY_DN976_c0_g1_i2.p2  ORF type:complete len:185 (+),score=1.07 TRINITY_DN976_c0_g1_i2:1151-1705(+)
MQSKLPLGLRMAVRAGRTFNLAPGSIVRAAGPWGPNLIKKYRAHMAARFSDIHDDESIVLDYTYHMAVAKGSGEFATNHILGDRAFAKRPLINRLHALRVPTLFMYGAQDWMDCQAGREASATLAVPNEVLIVPNAGHNIFVDNPPAFHEMLYSSLTKLVGCDIKDIGKAPSSWELLDAPSDPE